MGKSYFATAREEKAYQREIDDENAKEAARIEDERRKLAAKIVMATVDQIVNQIIRPGPKPEERECYEMAGELRAMIPDLETLAKQIIDVNNGVQ
jgi:hypothetical protein